MTRDSWRRSFSPSSIETRKRRTRDDVTSGLIDVGGGGCGGFGGIVVVVVALVVNA